MKHSFDVRQLIRSLLGGSDHKNRLTTFDRRPEDYWKSYWIPKSIDEAIDYLSKERRISKKRMTEELLLRGLGDYIGDF